jgi:metal transporter CNNM
MMDTILSQGYSRIPIFSPDNNRNFIGMLLVKILITYDPEDALRVRDFALATLPETSPYTSCLDIINFFQEGKSHMVLVSDDPGTDHGALGVVTLEDVIEELIGEEIVDESDVFIDVHKAIRRMAPADTKRYRMSKNNKLVEVDEAGMMSESERENDRADHEDAPLLTKIDSRRSSHANNTQMQQIPGTTFMMRRKSSNASDAPGGPAGKENLSSGARSGAPLPLRSNTTDLRQHLKHLGPSNLATKPRDTKFKSVKIKPGVSTIPEGHAPTLSAAASAGASPERSRSLDLQRGARETSPLLADAGKGASDGVAALHSQQASYGTNDGSISGRLRGMSDGGVSAAEASKIAEQNTTSPPARPPTSDSEPPPRSSTVPKRSNRSDTLKVPGKSVVQPTAEGEDDTVGEMSAPSRDRSKSRRAARSGSITETTVDVGGVKKIVLDTQSSSSAEDVDGVSPIGGNASATASRTSLLNGSKAGNDGADEGESSTAEGGKSGVAVKKRKKRAKRKKGGAEGE